MYHQEREREKESESESARVCVRCVFFSFFSFFFPFVCWKKNLPAIFFSFKSLVFPTKENTHPKSFEANGARGRLDEEGSLNVNSASFASSSSSFFSEERGCFEGFLEGRRLRFSGDHA